MCLVFYCQRCRCGFHLNFPIRIGGQRIFSLLVHVDAIVHCEFSFRKTRCNLGDWYTLWYNSYFVFMHTIGFTAVKNTDCLFLLRLLNVFHLHFRRDTSIYPLATVHCLVMQDQRDCEVFGRVRDQTILEPFLQSTSLCQTSNPSIN